MSEQNNLDAASRAYQDHIMQGLESMSSAADAINQSVKDRIRSIPEAFFVSTILPIVRDWVAGRDTAQVGVWMNVADGINNPINVVDENGQVVAIVPPPFIATPTPHLPPSGRRFTTVHQIVQRQSDSLNNGDVRAVMEVEQELINIFNPKAGDEAKAVSLMNLAKIYRRYDLPMEELFGDAAPSILQRIKDSESTTSLAGNKDSQDNGAEEQFVY